MPGSPDLRRAGAVALALVAGVVGMIGVAEGLVRALSPTPRVPVVRLDQPKLTFETFDGVDLWWETEQGTPFRHDDCPGPGTTDVLLAGDSVFYTVDPPSWPDRVAEFLQRGLAEAGRDDVCVVDASHAGLVPEQQLAYARWGQARFGLDLLVLLVWKTDDRFTRLGDALVDLDLVATGPDGLPPTPLPSAVNRWLLGHSRLWRYGVLATATPAALPPRPFAQAYGDALAWAAQAGVPVLLLEAAPLDRPFAASEAEHDREVGRVLRGESDPSPSWKAALHVQADAAGVPYVLAASLLDGRDVTSLRMDTCCHLNGAGHRALGEALVPVVRDRLEGR